ncbi:hypothetical protein NB640_02035 [Oxalobacter vibrioformis]|uniref:Uncharacterized protein n=1 Tax=Oxalobacter vibrioformis TaxID=933080 RepID=A0A9E9M0V0_9BURK|nr:hypothetical protein [Oxalobacter vibrioformis]WAW10463.1 hypothetical protein NB640_02035 [Oxalobacter vibrioformis]
MAVQNTAPCQAAGNASKNEAYLELAFLAYQNSSEAIAVVSAQHTIVAVTGGGWVGTACFLKIFPRRKPSFQEVCCTIK